MKDKIKFTFDEPYDQENKPTYSALNVCGVMVESNSEMGYTSYAPIEQVKKWYNIDVTNDEADAICIGKYYNKKTIPNIIVWE